MESVPAFLDDLAGRLVPACDPAVVRAVFARASAGYTGPRGRDGRRVTAITPSGVPFEASVSTGAGRPGGALRYVTETATSMPFFGPRLAAQRAALDELIGWLPAAAQPAATDLRQAVDVLFPDPGAVPARTRFATTFGVVHRDEVPGGLAGLKLYGNLRADGSALGRLAARWHAFAALRDTVDGLGVVVPHFVTVEVDAGGRRKSKLYLRTQRPTPAALVLLARRVGAEATDAFAALERAGASDAAWGRRFFVCCEASPDTGEEPPELSLHLPAKALALDAAGMARVARALVQDHEGSGASPGGGTEPLDALDALHGAAQRAGGSWTTTVVAVGLARGGGIAKVNAYLAPDADAGSGSGSGLSPG